MFERRHLLKGRGRQPITGTPLPYDTTAVRLRYGPNAEEYVELSLDSNGEIVLDGGQRLMLAVGVERGRENSFRIHPQEEE